MRKRGKKYIEAKNKVEKGKLYSIEEAVKLAKDLSQAKFDETVEVVFRLGLDTTQSDQQLRGAVVLPNGTGKTQKVLVIAAGDAAKAAEAAGADYVGVDEYLEKIEKENWFDFDVVVTTPDLMAKVGKLGKILGPKGLMPNPKTGTVTTDMKKAVSDIKAGKIQYRTDKDGNVHVPVGKVSFTEEALIENIRTIYEILLRAKPASAKGIYMKNMSISTTMGPGIKVDIALL
ncbi:MAG TPA: 50S ribosomal protein L1 [Tenericutes bacterium]|nr:50S ribosomal protein L1 [Mycoplasmatota bacterium]